MAGLSRVWIILLAGIKTLGSHSDPMALTMSFSQKSSIWIFLRDIYKNQPVIKLQNKCVDCCSSRYIIRLQAKGKVHL